VETLAQLPGKHSLTRKKSVIPEQTHKRCTKCCEWLPFSDFPAHKRMHNGLSSHCRACHRAATQAWRERHRDEINRARREAYGSSKPHRYPESRASARKVA
jgi:hypothetical protein